MFDWGAERIRLLTNSGRLLDRDTGLHAMVELWCRTREVDGAIAIPLSASQAVEVIAARYGHEVIRPGRSRRELAAAVLDGRAAFAGSESGGFIFSDFFPAYDGVLSTGMAVRMLAKLGVTLDEIVAEPPEFHKAHHSVRCPADRKGAVMRAITEGSGHERAALGGSACPVLGRVGTRVCRTQASRRCRSGRRPPPTRPPRPAAEQWARAVTDAITQR